MKAQHNGQPLRAAPAFFKNGDYFQVPVIVGYMMANIVGADPCVRPVLT